MKAVQLDISGAPTPIRWIREAGERDRLVCARCGNVWRRKVPPVEPCRPCTKAEDAIRRRERKAKAEAEARARALQVPMFPSTSSAGAALSSPLTTSTSEESR